MTMELGCKGRAETIVTSEKTAKTAGSGALDVFATPFMAALMEEAAWATPSSPIWRTVRAAWASP